jgi:hypothetical protein
MIKCINHTLTFKRARMRCFQIKLFDWILMIVLRKMTFSSSMFSRTLWTKWLIWSFFNFSYRNANDLVNLFSLILIFFHSMKKICRRMNLLYEIKTTFKSKMNVFAFFRLNETESWIDLISLNDILLDWCEWIK